MKKNYELIKKNFTRKAVGTSLAVALGITGLVACSNKEDKVTNDIPETVATIEEADDALIFAWANEEQAEIDQVLYEHPDYIAYGYEVHRDQGRRDFQEIYSTYHSYLEYKEIDEPVELMGNVIENTYQDFRDAAKRYSEDLYDKNAFEKSIYAEGIVLTEDKETFESALECPFYLPLDRALTEERIEGKFTLSNLPEGSIIVDGKVYVSNETLTKNKSQSLK